MSSLNSKLNYLGLSLSNLIDDFHSVCLVGSRAAGCAKPESDWDVVVFFDKDKSWTALNKLELEPKKRGVYRVHDKAGVSHKIRFSETEFGYGMKTHAPGLDLMFEDINCPMWRRRELCIHMTGYGIWLAGEPHWKASDIDWEGAVSLKNQLMRRQTRIIGDDPWWDNNQLRLWCLEHKVYVPPTAMLREIVPRTSPPPKKVISEIESGKTVIIKGSGSIGEILAEAMRFPDNIPF